MGPLHTPVADVAVTSLSYFGKLGAATAIGEQPIKMLVDSRAGARMCLGEALTNLIFAQITELKVGLNLSIITDEGHKLCTNRCFSQWWSCSTNLNLSRITCHNTHNMLLFT